MTIIPNKTTAITVGRMGPSDVFDCFIEEIAVGTLDIFGRPLGVTQANLA